MMGCSCEQVAAGMSYWGLAAHFPPSFPAPKGRTGAGRFPCGFILMLAGWRQTSCIEEKTAGSCVLSLKQKSRQAPHFGLCWRWPQITAQCKLLPTSSQGVECPKCGPGAPQFQQVIDHQYRCMSQTHARRLLQTWGS